MTARNWERIQVGNVCILLGNKAKKNLVSVFGRHQDGGSQGELSPCVGKLARKINLEDPTT